MGEPFVFCKKRNPVDKTWSVAKEESTKSICHAPNLYRSDSATTECVNNFDSFMGELFEKNIRQSISELLTLDNCKLVSESTRRAVSQFISFQLGRDPEMKNNSALTKSVAIDNASKISLRPTDKLEQDRCRQLLKQRGMENYADLKTHFENSDYDPYLSSILWNGIILGNTFFFSEWLLQSTNEGVITADHPVSIYGKSFDDYQVIIPLSSRHYLIIDELRKGNDIAESAPTQCPMPLFTTYKDELRSVINKYIPKRKHNEFLISNDAQVLEDLIKELT